MSTGGRTTNTQSEMLVNMLRDISVAKTLPDADLEFLVNLETAILSKLRAPLEAAAGQLPPGSADPNQFPGGPPPGAMPPGMGLPPMMPEAPPMGVPIPPPVGQPPVGGPPGLRAQPPSPSPDELARIMSNTGA